MASSSGTSSGLSHLPNSGSEEDLQAAMNRRKQKRMLSNRESARRSRMRKQKHLDDLMAQVNQLRRENSQIITSLNITTQHYARVESDNSVLRTQMVELSTRLQSLNEILHYMNSSNGVVCDGSQTGIDGFSMNPWNNNLFYVNQPIMASADMFQY
ncbi:Light-inducible protein CPRF2 [Acorus gramineus]|uniref:Light-inducible protein CPRF2 n=1 Tax=Acorus gramineus TaxID=55184 RepID=A0AAV9BVL0_ACOGR|nr:Light-inducible protein CPRF2 [Acorus gramineus]